MVSRDGFALSDPPTFLALIDSSSVSYELTDLSHPPATSLFLFLSLSLFLFLSHARAHEIYEVHE